MPDRVFGLCPCCNNKTTFLQSIQSERLFNILSQGGVLQRNNLFCTACIDWARRQTPRIQPYARPRTLALQIPTPQYPLAQNPPPQNPPPQNPPPQYPSLQYPSPESSSQNLPPQNLPPQNPPPQNPPPQNPQYSPISDSEGSQSASDPFQQAMLDPRNDPMMEVHNAIGNRLANPAGSPLHFAMASVPFLPFDERSADIVVPLPSPLNEAWDINDESTSNFNDRNNNNDDDDDDDDDNINIQL